MNFNLQIPRSVISILAVLILFAGMIPTLQAQVSAKKPNIVVIMAAAVAGIWGISALTISGMMGGRTLNIDRIANEGALFTPLLRSAILHGRTRRRRSGLLSQTPFRTGLLEGGYAAAAKKGLQDKDPTIAELLKPFGYATAQIGKNHLGDRNEYLPTVHGFDEFYGILYHLNAMEEPYQGDYPKGAVFEGTFRLTQYRKWILKPQLWTIPPPDPRATGTGHGKADDRRQWPLCRRIPYMDPAAKTNMEDIPNLNSHPPFQRFRRNAPVKTGKPFFLWHNSTRTHVWTHLLPQVARQERLRPLRRRHDGTGLGSRRDSPRRLMTSASTDSATIVLFTTARQRREIFT